MNVANTSQIHARTQWEGNNQHIICRAHIVLNKSYCYACACYNIIPSLLVASLPDFLHGLRWPAHTACSSQTGGDAMSSTEDIWSTVGEVGKAPTPVHSWSATSAGILQRWLSATAIVALWGLSAGRMSAPFWWRYAYNAMWPTKQSCRCLEGHSCWFIEEPSFSHLKQWHSSMLIM